MRDSGRRSINRHTELDVYRRAFDIAMRIFELSKGFPLEERFALTDQIRRSSRSVCANLAEAWRKRSYPAAFVSKLSDSTAEATETQTSIHFAVECTYLTSDVGHELDREYDAILGMLVEMMRRPEQWTFSDRRRQ